MRNNVYTTPGMIRNPQSRTVDQAEDEDIPNTDEFPGN